MRHDWIVDVLTDLHHYATRNDLPGLAEKVQAALAAALVEIQAQPDPVTPDWLRARHRTQ